MAKVKTKKTPKAEAASPKPTADETFVLDAKREDEEEKNDGEISEAKNESEEEDVFSKDLEELPKNDQTTKVKSAPHRKQKEIGKEEKQPNLAKILKAKGRNQKTQLTMKKASQNIQPSKSSGSKKQKMLEVILSGLSTMDGKKGVSFPALKKYILEEDEESNIASWERVKPKIKAALEQGFDEDLIIRPRGSENVTGLQGSFKLNKAKYSSRSTNSEKQNSKTKVETTKVPKKSDKNSLKTKENEAENIKKTTSKIKHRRSVSEDVGVLARKIKKLKKSKSLEAIAKVPKKKIQKVNRKLTPKKK